MTYFGAPMAAPGNRRGASAEPTLMSCLHLPDRWVSEEPLIDELSIEPMNRVNNPTGSVVL